MSCSQKLQYLERNSSVFISERDIKYLTCSAEGVVNEWYD